MLKKSDIGVGIYFLPAIISLSFPFLPFYLM